MSKEIQVDKPEQPILVRVSQTGGNNRLDLDLLGTDGDAAYKARVREKSLKKLQAENYDGSDEDWIKLIHHVLVSKADSGLAESKSDNLEVGCTISGKGSKKLLSIILRTKVEDITHKLGSIDLSHTDETDDVDLFGWTCQAIEQRDSLATQLRIGAKRAESAEASAKTLEKQLEELVKAKQEHENELLSKFALLLNEKKLHIRAQQQQIAKQDAPPVVAHPSPSKKRKLPPQKGDRDNGQSDESEAFEAMELDATEALHDDDDDDDDDEEFGDQDIRGRQSTPSRASTTSSEEDDDLDQVATRKSNQNPKTMNKRQQSGTPPPRSLPFATKRSATGLKQSGASGGTAKKTPASLKSTRQAESKVDDDDDDHDDNDESTAGEDEDDEL